MNFFNNIFLFFINARPLDRALFLCSAILINKLSIYVLILFYHRQLRVVLPCRSYAGGAAAGVFLMVLILILLLIRRIYMCVRVISW